VTSFVVTAAESGAGGAAAGELIGAGVVGAVLAGLVVLLGVLHRRRGLLRPLVTQVERRTGLPGWALIPTAIAGSSLVTAVWGYYWDVSWHIDRGRDPGAFANPAHWFIIFGLGGIAFAGALALILGDDRSPSSVRITSQWSVPAGAVLLSTCGLIALAGFPLDDIWHRLFGQDVTAWGPTHIQMIGGASLSTLGCWVLMIEGSKVADDPLPSAGRRILRFSDFALAGAFLIGLSTLQVEFDFGVPQFRQLEQPVLLAVAAGIALVAARLRLGRGGALAAVVFFLVLRGGLSLGVTALGRTSLHVPLYLVSAALVEVVALVVPRTRQLTFGAIAGLAIGTVGFASEWAWSRAFMPLGWSGDMLPEAVAVVALTGVAAGTLGGLVGRALSAEPVERQRAPRGVSIAAWLGVVAAIGFALPMTAHREWSALLTFTPASQGTANLTVHLDPLDAAEGASWFDVLWWQGSPDGEDGGSAITELVRQPDGGYTTTEPVHVAGSGKTLLRLHSGTSVQSVPVYLPEDTAIPAPGVPAVDERRGFVADKRILQREATTDNVNLERIAYAVLALIAAAWMGVISWGLVRLERPPTRARQPDSSRVVLPT
jgi:hypothetical protein